MAYHLHLGPREQEAFTVQEWADAVAAVEEIRKQAAKAD
jgi:hypothetical protein